MWRVHLWSFYTTVKSILHPNILHMTLFLYTTSLFLVKVRWLWVCLCLDSYYNTRMLAEELILQGGLALQSYVWFVADTNLNIAVYLKNVLSIVYLKILYIYMGMPIWHSFHKVVHSVLEYHSTIFRLFLHVVANLLLGYFLMCR